MATSLPTLCYRQSEGKITLALSIFIMEWGKPRKKVDSTVGIQMRLYFGNRWHLQSSLMEVRCSLRGAFSLEIMPLTLITRAFATCRTQQAQAANRWTRFTFWVFFWRGTEEQCSAHQLCLSRVPLSIPARPGASGRRREVGWRDQQVSHGGRALQHSVKS